MTNGPNRRRIALFGHFGKGNLGNEATLDAILHNLRRLVPDAEFTCVCTGPETVGATYHVSAVSSEDTTVKRRALTNPLAKWARRLVIGIPNELCRWHKCIKTLWGTDALIVPGTGLLTDAYGLFNWGPYGVFRWSAAAKLCRCKVFFISVGAGPLYTRFGRLSAMAALALANFRSYRDESSKRYLKAIGLWTENDPVYPDLAFSLLPGEVVRPNSHANARRLVVGIGLMEYAGKYSVERPTNHVQAAYLESLVEFVRWLLANGYDVRLLIGDLNDRRVVKEFLALLKRRSVVCDDDRITYEPVESFWDVLSQIAATDFVVATRFHTILFSVLMNKPVSAISFHHKCTSLMSFLGLAEYCHDINRLDANQLIEHFLRLEKNSQRLKASTAEKVKECRAALDDQYRAVIRQLFRAGDQTPATCTVESEAVPRPVDVNTRKGPK